MIPQISFAETPDEIAATWPVMHQLRPHLDAEAYLAQVLRLQAEQGFKLARMAVDGAVVAVAGLRFGEWLHGGRYLEIEDFVTVRNAVRKATAGSSSTGSSPWLATRDAGICACSRAPTARRRTGSTAARA
jgi:hypothetical protein